MSYITVSDLAARMGETRLENLCAIADTSARNAFLAEVIARAGAVIDGFASALYQTPLETTPLIQEWALSAAEYELYKRGPGSQVPEKIRESYQQTAAQLADLAARRIGTGGKLTPKTENIPPAPIRVQPGRPPVMDEPPF